MTAGPKPGEWPSPLSAELVAAGSGSSSFPAPVGEEVWFVRTVPEAEDADSGLRLSAIPLRDLDATPRDVLPEGRAPRTRVIEYGGRPWTAAGGVVVWCDAADQCLWAMRTGEPDTARALTRVCGGLTCYADPRIVGDEVWAVRERRPAIDSPQARRDVVAVPLSGGEPRVVLTAQHFLTSVRVSPDGQRMCWIGWDHPAMPWDGTVLQVADVVAGVAGRCRTVLGGPTVAVCQAEWADATTLYALADPDGWWNLHSVDVSSGAVVNLWPVEQECGGALWRVGSSWFAVLDDGRVAMHRGVGARLLTLFDPATGDQHDVATEWTEWSASVVASGTTVCGTAGSSTSAHGVVVVDASTGETRAPQRPDEWPDHRPAIRPVELSVDGRVVHAVLHEPRHPAHVVSGPGPWLVQVHGGPTSRDSTLREDLYAFFTSRGIGVLSVEYGGSTGFGRAYRERLRGQWGVVDVEDTVAAAQWLVAQGLADPGTVAVRGGSAGGWTSLGVAGRSDAFCAHTVYYPISDALAWERTTHDFESHYQDSLIGPMPGSEALFAERSPVRRACRITKPVLLLQGLDDVICPPEQAQVVVDALVANDVPHRYLTFAGERHGFRRASSLAAALTAELEMYAETMEFTPQPGASP